jgi:V8-like Glu-specific endopeptidase
VRKDFLVSLIAVVAFVNCPLYVCAQQQANSQVSTDVLSRHTLDELKQVLASRTNKTLFGPEPADLKSIPTTAIADNIISRQKTLYGYSDQRMDYFEIQDPEVLKIADSVASVIPIKFIQFGNDSIQITGQELGEFEHLCAQEAYYTQPVAAGCTAFIVGPDLIATAGHCVDVAAQSRIVFGFRELKDTSGVHAQVVIPNSQVYKVAQVVAAVGQDQQHKDPQGIDYAILKVDRPITDHAPLALDLTGQPAKDTLVYALGYPTGIPLKLVGNATVQSVSGAAYFTANLDTFAGNSGSPVFNFATNHVQGILVRGGTDYESVGTCERAFVCPLMPDPANQDCRGEDATQIGELASTLTGLPANKSLPVGPQPLILKTFRSGPKRSGFGASFSPPYTVVSDPAPPGYKIAGFSFSLTGDRGCNAWSTCKAEIEGDKVVFTFTLQGHGERLFQPGRGVGVSEGALTVKYALLQ